MISSLEPNLLPNHFFSKQSLGTKCGGKKPFLWEFVTKFTKFRHSANASIHTCIKRFLLAQMRSKGFKIKTTEQWDMPITNRTFFQLFRILQRTYDDTSACTFITKFSKPFFFIIFEVQSAHSSCEFYLQFDDVFSLQIHAVVCIRWL